jgi:hypothetical protein
MSWMALRRFSSKPNLANLLIIVLILFICVLL